jgi:hypothetical protein
MTIKVRLNADGKTFRVVSWTSYMYLLNWKTIKHFETIEETKEYIKELTVTDKSRLDIKEDAYLKLYGN